MTIQFGTSFLGITADVKRGQSNGYLLKTGLADPDPG